VNNPDPNRPQWDLRSVRSALHAMTGILFLVVVLANYPS
jgi:hypothetical protein